jgi:hypothetical protein
LVVIATQRCGNGGVPASLATQTMAPASGLPSLASVASLTPPSPPLLEPPNIGPSLTLPLELPAPLELLELPDAAPLEPLETPPSPGAALDEHPAATAPTSAAAVSAARTR